ncbi:hypothetical protein GCM10010532_076090 [Dactylosporangium siamense]|uniref:Uncharacterized protein n=1 Tax=Dactylosporangium siamense TaxID=685454 RepID=A0A919PPK6_9ACTN|nr:hypothetical protein Dsi01nite_058300 [Dactylosporangium siamense]
MTLIVTGCVGVNSGPLALGLAAGLGPSAASLVAAAGCCWAFCGFCSEGVLQPARTMAQTSTARGRRTPREYAL